MFNLKRDEKSSLLIFIFLFLNSKFTPYIVSENFNSQDDVGRIVNRLLGQKLIFSQNEPYIQNAIDNKHYDSIYWLVKNGANWKDNLIYFDTHYLLFALLVHCLV